jgi:enamine deaminase RidA (YjgF/YER057c/UK114 family)
MGSKIETRLNELGITLPKPAAPAANYVPYVVSGNLIFVAGQIPVLNGEIKYKGRLGDGMSIEDGYQAARLCGLNIIAQAGAAAGDLDRIKRIVKLVGFVGCTADFTDHPKVINGASDLMVEVFGEPAGQHARVAVGAPSLPLGVAVEVDAVIEIA